MPPTLGTNVLGRKVLYLPSFFTYGECHRPSRTWEASVQSGARSQCQLQGGAQAGVGWELVGAECRCAGLTVLRLLPESLRGSLSDQTPTSLSMLLSLGAMVVSAIVASPCPLLLAQGSPLGTSLKCPFEFTA